MAVFKTILLLSVITAQPLVNEEILEPSVANEVEHALALVPTNVVPKNVAMVDFARLYATNGLNATQKAIRLVSTQKGGCWFYQGTNVTPVAVQLLQGTLGRSESQ